MAGHLRHRHALRQAKDLEIEIKVPFRPAVAAVHLQKLATRIGLPQTCDRERNVRPDGTYRKSLHFKLKLKR